MLIFQDLTAQNIEKFYVNMPDALNPTLSKQNRLELLEYHKAKQSDSTANRFGNKAYLVSLDTINLRIVVRNTVSSTFEMKVMMVDSTLTIGIIRTVCAPICQSSVEFYDTAWAPLSLQFTMPKAIDWMNEKGFDGQNMDRKWVKSVLESSFISLSFDPIKPEIIAKNNSLEFVTEVDRKLIATILFTKEQRFKLEGRKWIPEI
jgi:hypothetical protein